MRRITIMTVALLCVIAFCTSAGCFKLTDDSLPEVIMATADLIDPSKEENRITVNRYRTLIDRISERLGEDKRTMIAQCYYGKKKLEESGIKETCLNILEAVSGISLISGSRSFAEYTVDYVIFRDGGLSHNETIKFMSGPLYGGLRQPSK